jgi:Trk K+ transport system NAD-binding subunit
MPSEDGTPGGGWRWPVAVGLFLAGLIGLDSGVSLTERPGVAQADLLTMAYYSLGLFVVGGLDLGTPVGGPWVGRALLWIAYFGAPILTASAVIEAATRLLQRERWQLRRIRDHIVVVGTGDLTSSYLRVLRRHSPQVAVVVVDKMAEAVRVDELEQSFGVNVLLGDITHEYLLERLRLAHARRVVLLGDDNFLAWEAASKILRLYPALERRIVLHSSNLRFLRSMQDTTVAQQSIGFNSYHLAATGLVRDRLLMHFEKTAARDVVVIAGFGRFGQTVLEELGRLAETQLDTVAVIDVDADRRMLVAEEQQRIAQFEHRIVLEGDISHPEVWMNLAESVDLAQGEPVVILGTGKSDDNLRTALWIKRRFPQALVFARTDDVSEFAERVGADHDIHNFSITALVEQNIPREWVD